MSISFAFARSSFERVICIPTYEEFDYVQGVISDLQALPFKTVLLLNNNCRINSADSVIQNNLRLHQWLLNHSHQQVHNHYLIQMPTLQVYLIDHSTEEHRYPNTEGVGLARHELGELACEMIAKGFVTCPWIWCTDGDVRLPHNYFELPTIKKGVELMGYWHEPAPTELVLYELGLRYYTLGLAWAQSPLAFPTIGSCIAIHATTYQQIYGFPKRQAAEDFYLLNKAVKVAPVYYSNTKTLRIQGRPSDRVPFGTGQGMKAIADNNLEYDIYHPEIFHRLKRWLEILYTVEDSNLIESLKAIVPDYPYFRKLEKALQQPLPFERQIKRRFVFFDCFQTMRWIHHMRDHHFQSVPLFDAFKSAPFTTQLMEQFYQEYDIQVATTETPTPSLEQWQYLQRLTYDLECGLRGRTYEV